jgi:hypothetical protein
VKRGLGVSILIQRTETIQLTLTIRKGIRMIYDILDPHGSPYSRLLQHKGDAEDLFLPGSSWVFTEMQNLTSRIFLNKI